MKIKQLLPIAVLAVMLTPAAFAVTEQTESSQTLSIDLGKFIYITSSTTKATVVPDVNPAYDTFTISGTSLNATYHVVTNDTGVQVKLSALSKSLNALKPIDITTEEGTSSGIRLAFVNSATDLLNDPNQEQVDKALAKTPDTTGQEHPNVIALDFTQVITPDPTTPAEVTGTVAGDYDITFTLNSGIYDFAYTGAQSDTTSLSTADEDGIYTTTLTLSKVTAGS